MRLTIEILAAILLVFCITATSAAFAAGSAGFQPAVALAKGPDL